MKLPPALTSLSATTGHVVNMLFNWEWRPTPVIPALRLRPKDHRTDQLGQHRETLSQIIQMYQQQKYRRTWKDGVLGKSMAVHV